MTTLPGSARRSITGKPSGVFSTTPPQERMSRTCAAPGNSSASRRARLRTSGVLGCSGAAMSGTLIHSCGPPP
jgi:hypothetical protein